MPSTETVPSRESLPPSLVDHEQWICWREQDRDGKQTKVPIDPQTGQYASTTADETWTTFETAREYATSGDATGIGFVFTDDDPFVGVDLDDCRVPNTETPLDWARDIVDRLDSYTEISPSGTGYHVLVRGGLPGGRNRSGDIELYETARFFTVTGSHVEGTPREVIERSEELAAVYDEYVGPETTETGTSSESDDESSQFTSRNVGTGKGDSHASSVDISDRELLNRAKSAANGEKFERLWKGDTSGYESHSEADFALCALLAFWTGGEAKRVDRLFRRSGLMREKWDEVHFSDGSTYGEKTVERAIAGTNEFYDPSEDSPDDADAKSRRTVTPSASESAGAVTDSQRNMIKSASIDQSEVDRNIPDWQATIRTLNRELRALESENERLREELAEERAARERLQVTVAELESASVLSHVKRGLRDMIGW